MLYHFTDAIERAPTRQANLQGLKIDEGMMIVANLMTVPDEKTGGVETISIGIGNMIVTRVKETATQVDVEIKITWTMTGKDVTAL